jgi:hypothetical protein
MKNGMDAYWARSSAARTCGLPHVHTNGYCVASMGWPILVRASVRIRSYLKRYNTALYAALPPLKEEP